MKLTKVYYVRLLIGTGVFTLVSVSAFLIHFLVNEEKSFSRYPLDNYVMFKLLPGHFKMNILCFIESKENII